MRATDAINRFSICNCLSCNYQFTVLAQLCDGVTLIVDGLLLDRVQVLDTGVGGPPAAPLPARTRAQLQVSVRARITVSGSATGGPPTLFSWPFLLLGSTLLNLRKITNPRCFTRCPEFWINFGRVIVICVGISLLWTGGFARLPAVTLCNNSFY